MSEREGLDMLMRGLDRTTDYNQSTKYPLDSLIAIPSAISAYVVVSKFRPGVTSQYLLTFTDLPIAILGANDYGSVALATLPKCRWQAIACTSSTQWKAGAVASSPAAAASLTWGIGTAAASNTTLSTTMINVTPGTGVSPTAVTLGTPATTYTTAAVAALTAAAAASSGHIDGTTTASTLYVNAAVACTSDGGVLVTGTVLITISDFGSNIAVRG